MNPVSVTFIVPPGHPGVDVTRLAASLGQTWADVEVVVVHRGSADAEIAPITDRPGAPRLKYVTTDWTGSAAWNAGLVVAAGRYICVHAEGILVDGSYLEQAVRVCDASSSVAFVSPQSSGAASGGHDAPLPRCTLQSLLLQPLAGVSTLVRLAAIRAVGGYDESLADGYETWDLCLRLLEHGYAGALLPRAETADPLAHDTSRRVLGISRELVTKHRESYARHLPALLAAQDDERRRLADRVGAIEREIEMWLAPALSVRKQERDVLGQRLHELDESRRRLADADQLAERAAALQRQVGELNTRLDDAQHSIDALQGSTSWRVTAPLRALSRWTRRSSQPVRAEPARDVDDALVAALRAEYGVAARTATEVARGEESVGYLVETGTKRLFAKLHAHPCAVDLAFSLRVADALHRRLGLEHVVAPLPTRDGRLSVIVSERQLAVFDFIEGSPATSRPLESGDAARLGRLAASIHPGPDDLSLAHPAIDECEVRCLDTIERLPTQAARAGRSERTASRSEVERLLNQHHDNLQEASAELRRLQARCLSLPVRSVVTHGDLTLDNILIDPSGDYHVFDWTSARVAPPERDLLHFQGPWFDSFLAAYCSAAPVDRLCRDAFAFYLYRWPLDGVAYFGARALREQAREAEIAHDLEVLKRFLPIECQAIDRTLAEIARTARRLADQGSLHWLT